MSNPKILKYLGGQSKHTWTDDDNLYHRENGPAIIYYDKNNNILEEVYINHGLWHREDGPAYIHFVLKKQEFWFNNKKFDSLEELQKYVKHLCLE